VQTTRPRALAVAGALAIVYVLWGSTYLGNALAIETLPPLLMASVRFLVAGAILYALSGLGRGGAPRPTAQHWVAAVITGGPLFVLGNGGIVWGQQTVPSGIAALIVASVALWITILDRVFFGHRLGKAAVAGLVLGFGGVALLVESGGAAGADSVGTLVVVLGSIGWAAGSLLSRGAVLPSGLRGPAMQMLAGGVLLGVAGTAAGELGDVHLDAISFRSAAGFAYLVVFGSIVGFSAYAWLLRSTRTSLVATYAYVNPVVAVLLGWAFLGEDLSARTLVAGTIVVASVVLIVSARGPASAPEGRRAPSRRAPLRTADRLRAAAATRGK
jgi:drug/metabolite transporter (DMT)-like permease